jgi:transposase
VRQEASTTSIAAARVPIPSQYVLRLVAFNETLASYKGETETTRSRETWDGHSAGHKMEANQLFLSYVSTTRRIVKPSEKLLLFRSEPGGSHIKVNFAPSRRHDWRLKGAFKASSRFGGRRRVHHHAHPPAALDELYYEGPEATIHLIGGLLEELADQEQILGERQQRIIDAQHERNERQAAQLKRVKEKLERQVCLNYRLTRRIQELQAELERHERGEVRRDSHNSSLPPALDPPGVKAHNAVRHRLRVRRRTGKKVGGQVGHRGSTLRRVAAPDRVVTHVPQSCRRCAAALSDGAVTAVERRQVFELPPVRVEVTEHRVETRRCVACGERTKAEFPRGVRAPVRYGEGVRARATYLRKYQLLPFARTAEAMRELFGCAISPGTLHATWGHCAEKLVGTEARIKAALRAAEVIGADETGLRVAGKSHWIHVARTDYLTHYGADARRGKVAIEAIGILPTFQGVFVHGGWMAYDGYRQAQHALCNVHLLRELVYVEEVSAEQQQWTRPLAELLLDIKAEVGRAQGRGETKLSNEQRARFTARYDRLVRRAARLNPPPVTGKPDALSRRYKVVRAKRRDPARPLISRLQSRREQVLRFMTHFRIPFDNNATERDIRMVKLQQKISGCFRTEEGAKAFCRIRSYLSTARKQGYGVLTSLERAFRGKPITFNGLPRPE